MSGDFSSALYDADVMHRRLIPRVHGFSYRVFYGLFDLDELPRLGRSLRLFSLGKANFFSFYPQDHGRGDESSLRTFVEETLHASGHEEKPHRILLLAHPRMFGYVFNPLSIFYCFNEAGELTALLYQVTNTFGERHVYPCLLGAEARRRGVADNELSKLLYVSPFNTERGMYRIRLTEPGKHLFVHIRYMTAEGLTLLAALKGDRAPLSDRALLKRLCLFPLMTFKVIAAIHWEAFRLWLKRVPLVPRPQRKGGFLSVGVSSRIGAGR